MEANKFRVLISELGEKSVPCVNQALSDFQGLGYAVPTTWKTCLPRPVCLSLTLISGLSLYISSFRKPLYEGFPSCVVSKCPECLAAQRPLTHFAIVSFFVVVFFLF